MKLTRKQELQLIDIGLSIVISKSLSTEKKEKKSEKKHWTQTAAGKKKLAKRMVKQWKDKKNGKN